MYVFFSDSVLIVNFECLYVAAQCLYSYFVDGFLSVGCWRGGELSISLNFSLCVDL